MTSSRYSNYGPQWCEAILDQLNGIAFEVGIESDRKHRGSAVNVEVMDHDEAQQLFVLQVRQTVFHPRRFNRTRKDYFLCGRNENGNAFAHPIDVIATNANVTTALCRIWDVTPSVLPKIIRQGDVALIPERGITYNDVVPFDVPIFAVESHVIRAAHVYVAKDPADSRVFVAESVSITHEKEQHPSVACALAKSKLYRVQLGIRARTWGFARPTAD